jgi:hypothetical protein
MLEKKWAESTKKKKAARAERDAKRREEIKANRERRWRQSIGD